MAAKSIESSPLIDDRRTHGLNRNNPDRLEAALVRPINGGQVHHLNGRASIADKSAV